MVRRRGTPAAAAALPGPAAEGGRAGVPAGPGPPAARLAGGQADQDTRRRRPVRGGRGAGSGRPASRRAGARVGTGDPRPAGPGARLFPRHAGRADHGGRGGLDGRGRAAGRRRMAGPRVRRCGTAALPRAGRDHHDPAARGPALGARGRRRPVLPHALRPGGRAAGRAGYRGTGRPGRRRGGQPARRPLVRQGGRRPAYGRPVMPSRTGPPNVSGRWSLLPEANPDPTLRAHARAHALLDRYGILTKGAVTGERVPGGFAAVYPVLRAMEEAGRARRGYFVEGLGAAQFAIPGAVDRMRAMTQTPAGPEPDPWDTGPSAQREPHVIVLSAADPANAYGASLPWPERPDETPGGHRPGRKAGALVVLADGELVLYVERGGRTFLSWTDDPNLLTPAAMALASAVRAGALGRLTVERADGGTVYDSPLAHALGEAGFRPTPRGLRLRG